MWKLIMGAFFLATLAGCATQAGVRYSGSAKGTQNGENGEAYSPDVNSIESSSAQEVLEHIVGGSSPVLGMTVGNEEFFGNVPCRAFQMSGGQTGYACRHNNGKWQEVARANMINRFGPPSAMSPEATAAKRKWQAENGEQVQIAPRRQVSSAGSKESAAAPKSVPQKVLNEQNRQRPEQAPKRQTPVFTPTQWNGNSR